MPTGFSNQTLPKISHNFSSSPIFPDSIQLAKISASIGEEIPFSSPYVSLWQDLFQSTTPGLFPSLPSFLPVGGRENYILGKFGRKKLNIFSFLLPWFFLLSFGICVLKESTLSVLCCEFYRSGPPSPRRPGAVQGCQ